MQFLTALVDQSYTEDLVLSKFILFHNIFILDRSLKWYSIGLLVGISIKYRIGKKLQFLRNFLLTQYAKKANYLPPSDQRPKINLTNITVGTFISKRCHFCFALKIHMIWWLVHLDMIKSSYMKPSAHFSVCWEAHKSHFCDFWLHF